MFGLPILLTMLAVDLIGGFVVGLYARIRVRTARTPATLLAYQLHFGIAARRLAAGLRGCHDHVLLPLSWGRFWAWSTPRPV